MLYLLPVPPPDDIVLEGNTDDKCQVTANAEDSSDMHSHSKEPLEEISNVAGEISSIFYVLTFCIYH